MKLDIRDNIPPDVALTCVLEVVKNGKISEGEHGKKYYCWLTVFNTFCGEVIVNTRQYRKDDCFLIYKGKNNK